MSNFRPFVESMDSVNNSVTIRKNGTIYISDYILSRFCNSWKDISYIRIYIDDDLKMVGFKFIRNRNDSFFKESRKVKQEKDGISVSIDLVLKYFKVSIKKPCKLRYIKEGVMLILDLDEVENV
jgi:hypothetical protein